MNDKLPMFGANRPDTTPKKPMRAHKPMNDSGRASLVEELADLMQDHAPEIETHWVALVHNGVMPIIDRLLAERDVDALLDSVKLNMASGSYRNDNGLWVWDMAYEEGHVVGTGKTFTAAIRAAVEHARAATRQPHHGAQPAFPEYGEGDGL